MIKLEDIKTDFYNTHEYSIPESDTVGLSVEYFPDLNILMKTDLIFEGGCYDETIKCCPSLYKVNNIDEAWNIAIGYISEGLGDDTVFDEESETFYDENEYKDANRLNNLQNLLKTL